ncbi:hypothetical protein NEFER03_1951 [Nematocida sp. LUAm3]|nr:hypothetical protein NEFER03_1951 [Nematocida sp. LUAm3]KAI5176451.1 hypothetical protein NEFER02_2206 [Nematocida sp. LUAm2]KAI5179327.1 hypothetical protein NEFER01_2171 [Nematocida sp. LUAm1]
MKICVKKEKRRRAYTAGCMWKRLAVFMALLRMACSTRAGVYDDEGEFSANSAIRRLNLNSNREWVRTSAPIGEKEIAEILLEVFHIEDPRTHKTYLFMHGLEHLFTRMAYHEYKYYIDLKGFLIRKIPEPPNQNQHDKKLEYILERIGGIRCACIFFDSWGHVSFKLAKMFFDRVVFKTRIHICYMHPAKTALPGKTLSTKEMAWALKLPGRLKETWKTSTPIELIIEGCSEAITEYFLSYVRSRKIKKLKISNIEYGMELLGLEENRVTEDCPITLNGLIDTERVVLPQVKNNKYAHIELLGLPMLQELNIKHVCTKPLEAPTLQELTTVYAYIKSLGAYALQRVNTKDTNTPISAIVVEDLCMDELTFISMVTAYMASLKKDSIQSKEDKPARQVLEVENLRLYEMLYNFTETQDIPSPWMKVKNVTIYIEHCDGCGIPMENIVLEKCTKAALASVGIQCEDDPVYEYPNNSDIMKSRETCSKRLIYELANICTISNHFRCPNSCNCPQALVPLSLDIDLNNYERIQKAIVVFERRYSVVSVHAKYLTIKMRGSESPQRDISLMESIFKCLGPRINVDILCFYGMKELVGLNMPIQNPDLSFIIPYNKSTFIVNELYLSNSNISFITHILTKYSYSAETKICIDCKTVRKEHIFDLCQEMASREISAIVLRNAEDIMEAVCLEDPSASAIMRDKVFFEIGDSEKRRIKASDVAQHMSKNNALLLLYQSILVEMSQGDSKESTEGKKNRVYEFLVEETVEKSYDNLIMFSKKIYLITEVNITICSPDLKHVATGEQVYYLLARLRQVFVDAKTFCVVGLRIGEGDSLSALKPLTEFQSEYKLRTIYIKEFTIVKKDVNQADAAQKDIPEAEDCYECAEDCDLNCLVKQKFGEANVCISHLASSLLLKDCNPNDSKSELTFWEAAIANKEKCVVCFNKEIQERYIIRQCKHSMCRGCAVRWCTLEPDLVTYERLRCPYCREHAEFEMPFYFLCLKDPAKEKKIERQERRFRKMEENSAKQPPAQSSREPAKKKIEEKTPAQPGEPSPEILGEKAQKRKKKQPAKEKSLKEQLKSSDFKLVRKHLETLIVISS